MNERTFTTIVLIIVGFALLWAVDRYWPAERSSSFVGYSQSCWQVGDTLHVVTAKGDTVRFGVSKLEEER